MLTLRCEPIAGIAHSIGPAPYFRIEGGTLRIGPANAEVGTHQGGLWQIGGRYFTTLALETPTTIRFEGGDSCEGTHGPFDRVRLVDGVIRHGAHSGQLLARLDEESGSWHVYNNAGDCHKVIIEPA